MKDIDEIRRENIHLIESEFGGPTEAAKAVGMSLAQFSNLRDGAKDSKTGKRRGMRKDTARKIEAGAKKPAGWLDIEHVLGAYEPTAQGQQPKSAKEPTPDELSGGDFLRRYRMASDATRSAIDLILLPHGERASLKDGLRLAITILEDGAKEALLERKNDAAAA